MSQPRASLTSIFTPVITTNSATPLPMPKRVQTSSDANSRAKIGTAVGASVGAIVILGLSYLYYRYRSNRRHQLSRRLSRSTHLQKKMRGEIGSPTPLVDSSNLPGGFTMTSAAGFGPAIKMESIRIHSVGDPHSFYQQFHMNNSAALHTTSGPNDAESVSQYLSVPSSPSNSFQAYDQEDTTSLHRQHQTANQTPEFPLSPSSINPTLPLPTATKSYTPPTAPQPSSRSARFCGHPDPLGSNPSHNHLNQLWFPSPPRDTSSDQGTYFHRQ